MSRSLTVFCEYSWHFVSLSPDSCIVWRARTAVKTSRSEFILSLDGGRSQPYRVSPGQGRQSSTLLARSECNLCCAEFELSPPFHPHSSVSDSMRSVQVGCSRFSRCCHLLDDLASIHRIKVGPGSRRSHRNSAFVFRIQFRLLNYAAVSICLPLLRKGSYASQLTHR